MIDNSVLVQAIKERAKVWTEDNVNLPTQRDYMMAENAMLIGACVYMELATEQLRNEWDQDLKLMKKEFDEKFEQTKNHQQEA